MQAPVASTIDVVVIGAGHSGLATSYLLSEHGIGHVVLERGEVANAWRERCWESLQLLTPNRRTRLPGFSYNGDDPDGFMSMPELVRHLENYAAYAGAPVLTQTNVSSVSRDGDAYRVRSDRGEWRARAVVIASGACAQAAIPRMADDVPQSIRQLTPAQIRSSADVAEGGVLVVGASATGLQLADELVRSGHAVTIASGEHVRMPRRYRGRDIFDWLEESGISDERYDEVDDIARGRRLPSPQLIGDNNKAILDLNSLTDLGVRLTGRLMGVRDGVAQFSGSLRNVCALADLKMRRLLRAIDDHIEQSGRYEAQLPPAELFADTRVETSPPLTLSLDDAGIRTIVWATGYKPDYEWLDLPVFDRKGRLDHDGGVVCLPGLYAMGLPLMRRRKSSFIYGVEDDARDITAHLVQFLNQTADIATRTDYCRTA
jgi:putative flavoprotein involved in K+ transport